MDKRFGDEFSDAIKKDHLHIGRQAGMASPTRPTKRDLEKIVDGFENETTLVAHRRKLGEGFNQGRYLVGLDPIE